MGFVVVVSLPVVLFIIIVALVFYLLGRERGRYEVARSRIQQHHGPPVPAPPDQVQPPPPPQPQPDQEKPSQSQV